MGNESVARLRELVPVYVRTRAYARAFMLSPSSTAEYGRVSITRAYARAFYAAAVYDGWGRSYVDYPGLRPGLYAVAVYDG